MKFTKFDVVDYLGSEKDMAAYLSAVLDENDPDLLLAALGDIARAKRAFTRHCVPVPSRALIRCSASWLR